MSNAELRRRKVKEHEDRSSGATKKRKPKTTETSLFNSLLCLILSGTILTVFLVLYTDQIPWYLGHHAIDHVAKKFGYHKPVYAVIIDAGSTGSRVLAYTFHESYLGGNLVLDKELFEYNKPGLSSFAKEPKKGVDKIAELLEKAKKEIPQQYWHSTPLVLKATAGLRLLPTEQAENLLNSLRELFLNSPFKTNDRSIEIMDGTDEGIFSWFTVNFLLEKINGNPSNMVAALDLGGGSTQVTFSAITPASLKEEEYIHQAMSPKGLIPVYTHSYLGLGLQSARVAIITAEQGSKRNVTSECVNPIIKDKIFQFNGIEYHVSGLQKNYPTIDTPGDSISIGEKIPVVDFNRCSEIIEDYIHQITSKTKPPEELPLKNIFAFSYYYDRASDVGLIDFTKGGQVKVSDFKKYAAKICQEANADQPFACLDLNYISLLLEKGFGLDPSTKIYLYKKINGHEISWALGAAHDVLTRKQN